MTSPMYKDGSEMEVTDDPIGRAVLIKAGWTEEQKKKTKSAKNKGTPQATISLQKESSNKGK